MRWCLLLLFAGTARADLNVPSVGDGKHTFCEFQIVEQRTHRPRGGFGYTVTLPDGKKVRGRVPRSGVVHVASRRAGTCTIELDLPPGSIVPDGAR